MASTSRLGQATPGYMLGIDACATRDRRTTAPSSCGTLEHLGYSATCPYPGTGEAHHMVFTRNPIPTLRKRGRIPKDIPEGAP